MKKDAQAVLLLLVGGTLLKISIAGTYVRYVKASQLPLLIIAGSALVIVGLITLWQVVRTPAARTPAAQGPATRTPELVVAATSAAGAAEAEPIDTGVTAVVDRDAADVAPAGHDHASHSHAGHSRVGDDHAADDHAGHDHGGRVGWLLLLPALALLMFAPPSLGAFQASRNGTALRAQESSDFAPLPAGDPVRVSLLDYASRAVFDRGQSLAQRQVTMSGFIIAGPDGQPYLARMVVNCCAADARPVKIGLTGDVPARLAPDTWIEVVGNYLERTDRDPVNGEVIPYIQVISSHDVTAPESQYES